MEEFDEKNYKLQIGYIVKFTANSGDRHAGKIIDFLSNIKNEDGSVSLTEPLAHIADINDNNQYWIPLSNCEPLC